MFELRQSKALPMRMFSKTLQEMKLMMIFALKPFEKSPTMMFFWTFSQTTLFTMSAKPP